ncbi:MAG: hypothetical protein R2754_13955 [Microthrixaceae bacterium]
MLVGPRARHALAQFDPRVVKAYWRAFDHTVTLPWWLATAAFPTIIGSRLILLAGAIPLAALRNTSRWKRSPDRKGLEQHAGKTCVVVLRTFGQDGSFLFSTDGVPQGDMAPTVRTLEDIVADAASSAGVDSVLGFHDHGASSFPKGVRQVEVEDATWKSQFDALLPSCSAIVVMATPGLGIREGLRSELDTIRQEGLASRVVVVGPPGIDPESRRATHEIYRLLGWHVPRAGYLAMYREADGRSAGVPSLGELDRCPAERYESAIDGALRSVLAGVAAD